jgi:hypothetical protein
MSKPSPPKPTPPGQTAAAQVSQNIGTAIANSYLNNVNQYGPDGAKEFDITGYKEYVDNSDPNNPITYQIPTYAETTTLSDEQKAIKAQQDAASLNLSSLANQQSGFLQDYMAKPFQYDVGEHEKWAGGLYDKLNSEREDRQQQALQTQLANSGVKLGSDAYGRALQTQGKATEDARNQFMLDSYKTGFQSAQATRNQPINEIGALMSGGQVSMPVFGGTPNYTIPTTDRAGINAAYDNYRLQAWQMEQAQRGQMLGGLFSLGSALISDERAKKDKQRVGTKMVEGDDGSVKPVGLFAFNYKGEPGGRRKHVGVMAQELRKVKPSAVKRTPGGLLAVDYARV